MKKIFALLLCFKESILFTWLFFFVLSFVGKTTYVIFELFLISGLIAFLIYLCGAITIFLIQKFDKDK